jgi:hypothetical protein
MIINNIPVFCANRQFIILCNLERNSSWCLNLNYCLLWLSFNLIILAYLRVFIRDLIWLEYICVMKCAWVHYFFNLLLEFWIHNMKSKKKYINLFFSDLTPFDLFCFIIFWFLVPRKLSSSLSYSVTYFWFTYVINGMNYFLEDLTRLKRS